MGPLLALFSDLNTLYANPVAWVAFAFQLWMLVDAVRREEWLWAVFIFFFSVFSALLYFILVYRAAPAVTQGFELPGARDRRRIKELQDKIHHLDKAHHHSELGDLYFSQGKLDLAEKSYRAALERDETDRDTRAHLGQCLLRRGRPAEARPLLEGACSEDARHDYGHSLMALAECQAALGDVATARHTWERVLENHSYARAKVQFAELLTQQGEGGRARHELEEVIADDAHAPAFQRKREKVWVKRAARLLAKLRPG
jgi:hypothetical protein